jgi:hypothetical protein
MPFVPFGRGRCLDCGITLNALGRKEQEFVIAMRRQRQLVGRALALADAVA